MSYKVHIKGSLAKRSRILKAFNASSFNECITDLIVDVSHINIRTVDSHGNWIISIIQDDKEATDIIEFFKEKFKKKYCIRQSKHQPKCKYLFTGYRDITLDGRKLSFVEFHYMTNFFERKLNKL